ncbi:hypothetical protein C4D60_Mb04t05050 [Musa balbisiana]|uniref:Uncharacterized protein n=1 Tax=Musa balbisiana TaxID=52838 RepID=A0A4S8K9R0_MUSBA|nr:hypothetical protein C4D60_Mb04t05050 [Musa balbisiana]
MGAKEERGRTGEEEAEAEAVVAGEGEVEEEEMVLPNMPVRVLLVEGDDSTRQIIAALLRKCGYRVAASSSDGLKAWETLREKPQSIDLVLTEVDLPSVSGYGLLSMIMDHETCRNIPVIMMSSHDSVSIVFKCMLKGAADFLIKPIRKNELRNLWQHVWRRQIASGQSGVHEIQDKCDAKHKLKAHSRKGGHSTDYTYMECSDAQSSCARSDVATDIKHNHLELKQRKAVEASVTLNDGENIQFYNAPFYNENAANAASKNVDVIQKECMDSNTITNEKDGQKCYHDITSIIRVSDNQSKGTLQSRGRNTVQSGSSDMAIHDIDVIHESCPTPHLELSLKRCERIFPEKHDCDEINVWNHSNSSAFSLYNSRTVMPTSLNSGSKGNDPNCTEHSKYQGSTINMEETTFEVVEHSVQCNPLQVIPFTLPVGSMPLCSEYDTAMQHMIYTESGHQFWSTSPSVWLKTTTETNSSHQPTQEDQDSVEGGIPDGKNTRSSSYHYVQEQEEHMEVDKQRHILSAAGESGSSSICNGGRSQPNSSASGGVLSGTTRHTFATNIFRPITVTANDEVKLAHEGTKVTDGSMSQREMALNKFRLKRKERCFEKKVRYHARKLLAEQRPRVKGQFVRQAKLNPQPTFAGAFQSDSAAW